MTSLYLNQYWLTPLMAYHTTRPQTDQFRQAQLSWRLAPGLPVFMSHPESQPRVSFLLSIFLNTLRPKQNGHHFADIIFKWIFFNEKSCLFNHYLYFTATSKGLSLRVQLTICQHWFRSWLVTKLATIHSLIQCWPRLHHHPSDPTPL